MILAKTDCKKCIHSDVCRYRNNAKHAMDTLKETAYGCGPNSDCCWDYMSDSLHIVIEISCPNYNEKM